MRETDEEFDKAMEEEIRKQGELDDAALATDDDAVILARLKDALEWEKTSTYSPTNNPQVIEEADALAKRLYGKSFKEMSEEFDEPD
jgi:hypothetical protein